ncbi:glycosyltransferase family 4 protein [Robbsia sp. KACC 23696]|uniref:MraY family glycosyltransferase n=1 Tax=Robbsia sp. KACC 23696 TaxID=3149231 RepID=UPI00325AE2CF
MTASIWGLSGGWVTAGGTVGVTQALAVGVAAGGICWIILAILLKTGWAWDIATDVPNHRSLHTRPTPRVGGLGLLPACLCVGAVLAPSFRLAATVALGLVLMSQIDDRRGLPARVRFAAHLLSALVLVGVSGSLGSGRSAIAAVATALDVQNSGFLAMMIMGFVVIAFVWTMNLYNFMDGMDGLAGGMAAIGFSIYAVAAFFAMHNAVQTDGATDQLLALRDVALASSAIAGAAVGFLLWNAPPAKLFLGDAGSVPLGFLAAALGWLGWTHGAWSAAFPFLVFAPFATDATVTLLRRLFRGERFWEAHREHYYQRMVRMGWSRRGVLLIWYGMMLFAGACALVYQIVATSYKGPGWDVPLCRALAIALCFFGLAGLGVVIDRRWAQYARASATR